MARDKRTWSAELGLFWLSSAVLGGQAIAGVLALLIFVGPSHLFSTFDRGAYTVFRGLWAAGLAWGLWALARDNESTPMRLHWETVGVTTLVGACAAVDEASFAWLPADLFFHSSDAPFAWFLLLAARAFWWRRVLAMEKRRGRYCQVQRDPALG